MSDSGVVEFYRGRLKLQQVENLTSLTRWTIDRLIEKGRFPKPIAERPTRLWSRLDIQNWIAQRCADSGKDTTASRLINLDAVVEATGYHYSTIYRRIQKNRFPAPVRLSSRRVAWIRSEIRDWVHSQIKRADLL